MEFSIPSRGFWFFEAGTCISSGMTSAIIIFNPLAGILVF